MRIETKKRKNECKILGNDRNEPLTLSLKNDSTVLRKMYELYGNVLNKKITR